jgi:hypothetical protein
MYFIALVGAILWVFGLFVLEDSEQYRMLGLGLMLTGAIFLGATLVVGAVRDALAAAIRALDVAMSPEEAD